MNYYWRRCVAAVLAVFLLAVAAPSAQAAKSAETKANLCKFILTLGWPAAESVNEMCEKVGVPLSVFPNAASGGYSGNELLANLEAAEKYYSQCKDEYAKAEEELKQLKEELANASTPAEAAEIQKKIDEIENNMKGVKAKMEGAEKQRDAWADKMKEYEGYTDEDWNKMLPDLKKYYGDMAKNASEMASNAAKDLAWANEKLDSKQKDWDDKLASINADEAAGKLSAEEAQKARDEANAYFGKETEELKMYQEKYQNEYNQQTENAATYSNLAENATASDAQSYYTQQAQTYYNNAQTDMADYQNNYAQLQKELQDQQAALAAAQSGGDPDKIKELEAAVAQAEQNLNNAQYQLDLAGQDLNAAQQAYNNAQGGGSSGGEDCWMEKQCHKEQKKDCWIDKETGKEECKYWDEEVCEEVKVCK